MGFPLRRSCLGMRLAWGDKDAMVSATVLLKKLWRGLLGKGLDVQALANLLGDDLFEAAHDMVGNLLGELLTAVMTQAFRGAVLEEKLGGVNLQNLGQLVYDIRRQLPLQVGSLPQSLHCTPQETCGDKIF